MTIDETILLDAAIKHNMIAPAELEHYAKQNIPDMKSQEITNVGEILSTVLMANRN